MWLEFVENPSLDFVPPVASEYFDRQRLEQLVTGAYKKVYFTLPFIAQEIKKMRSLELLCSRIKSGFSLLRGA